MSAHARELSALHEGNPETSHEAAESVPEDAITLQKGRVLDVVEALVVATDKQIIRTYYAALARNEPKPSEQSIRSRRAELTRAGLIEWSGEWSYAGRRRERLWRRSGK